MHRIISKYDFESQSGYIYNPDLGKPLSAYNYAKDNFHNIENYAVKTIKNIVECNFEKQWTQKEIEEIDEPIPVN